MQACKIAILYCCCIIGLISCDVPLSLSLAEAQRRAFKDFKVLRDTSEVGIMVVTEDSVHHWFVAYNKSQISPCVYLFHHENSKEPSHKISLHYKQD